MRTAFCTISTQSHIFKAKVLLKSIREHSNTDLFCLLTDSNNTPTPHCGETYHTLDVLTSPNALHIKGKYRGNKLRWACKSLYLSYLLQQGYDAVIYADNDTYFFTSPEFLFRKLSESSVLLTPHFYQMDASSPIWLEANYTVGLYNAGFIGVSQGGAKAMDWWADCCLYNIKKARWRGLFDDQKYLDLLPVVFENIEVLKHKGCNVAGWNMVLSPRSTDAMGELLLGGAWPLVFMHFAPTTFRAILSGEDPLLRSHMHAYVDGLKGVNSNYRLSSDLRRSPSDFFLYFRYIRWQLARIFE